MNHQRWEFTDLEFRVLCERFAKSNVPDPLTFMARIPYLDDYEREKYLTWERLQPDLDPVIPDIIPLLYRPDVAIKVLGWYDGDFQAPEKWIRGLAVRSGTQGYLVTQAPGETFMHSSGYTIIDCGPRGLAEAVVRLLPPNIEAGRRGSIPIVTDNLDDLERISSGGSLVTEEVDSSGAGRSAEFFGIPADRTGSITIVQGHSKFGPRGILEHILVWRDLPSDGRYVIELPNGAPMAVGMGKKWLTSKIDNSVETILERIETHWELQD
ncbi:ESX secretion-associated protein EspG [Nocardia sp. NPDC050710]|uniref:ESX secretion-associated protein EspG n=1 Tax=Nocardia sp. NPDC050710 TaxID=3157220 RepID=UPI0033D980E4